MDIRIRRAIDYILLLLIFLQLVILEFLGFGGVLNKTISFFIIVRIILLRGRQWQYGLLCGIGLLFLFLVGLLLGESWCFSNAKSNFLMLLYPFLYTYYIVFVCRNSPDVINTILEKCFWLFNITMIINTAVLLIQIYIPYSIMASVEEANRINFYLDEISGLFEYASTHVVCLFTTFIILYDLSYAKKISRKGLRMMIWTFIVVLVAVSLFIAANNDNKAFFLLLPISIAAFWFSRKMTFSTRILKIIRLTLVVLIAAILVYNSNHDIKQFIDDKFLRVIDLIMRSYRGGNSIKGSGERIAILRFAISKPKTWLTGTGFGSAGLYESGYKGFYHFGQADLGSLLVLGGGWFVAILILYYMKSFSIIVGEKSPKEMRVLKIAIFVILFCAAVYTQCFTSTNLIDTLILIMLAFRTRELS